MTGDEQRTSPGSHAVAAGAAPEAPIDFRIVAPDLPAGLRVHRPRRAPRSGDIKDAVHHEGRGFLPVLHPTATGARLGFPGEPESSGVGVADRSERRESIGLPAPAESDPLARLGVRVLPSLEGDVTAGRFTMAGSEQQKGDGGRGGPVAHRAGTTVRVMAEGLAGP